MVYILSLQNLVVTGSSGNSGGPSGINSGTNSGINSGMNSGMNSGTSGNNSSQEGIKSNHQTTYLPVTNQVPSILYYCIGFTESALKF